ncbi:hypothetical protein [Pseudalkalibacillus hwajinpoensis]|uniref:Uncharacterized protein n=1 Tax=Guptibacillus hwajinpoensis TaxID=208199 RepID=A0A4U1MP96_9BACL|nr:hypothetical protein [Pseudalkalibacillus hwajinpoensis]TKD72340.1 hypothetical protein FBF83_06040 [Pseudalkalibacillus hwajinpoensis]
MRKKGSILLIAGLTAGTLLAGCGSDGAEENTGAQTEESTLNESSGDNSMSDNTSGDNSASDGAEGSDSSEVNLDVGIDTVLTDLDSMNSALENSSEDSSKINELGTQLQSHWDLFDQKLKEEYPEDYSAINEEITPLIEESTKDEVDIEKTKTLLDEAVETVTKFKDEVPVQ